MRSSTRSRLCFLTLISVIPLLLLGTMGPAQAESDRGNTRLTPVMMQLADGSVEEVLAEGPFQIIAMHSAKCLDVRGGEAARQNGALVQQWQCNPQLGNQVWWLTELRTAGTYQVIADHSGKCLDIRGGEAAVHNGALAQQWSCTPGAANQTWVMDNAGITNMWALHTLPSGPKCLDVRGGVTEKDNGALVQQWRCNNNANQIFALVRQR